MDCYVRAKRPNETGNISYPEVHGAGFASNFRNKLQRAMSAGDQDVAEGYGGSKAGDARKGERDQGTRRFGRPRARRETHSTSWLNVSSARSAPTMVAACAVATPDSGTWRVYLRSGRVDPRSSASTAIVGGGVGGVAQQCRPDWRDAGVGRGGNGATVAQRVLPVGPAGGGVGGVARRCRPGWRVGGVGRGATAGRK